MRTNTPDAPSHRDAPSLVLDQVVQRGGYWERQCRLLRSSGQEVRFRVAKDATTGTLSASIVVAGHAMAVSSERAHGGHQEPSLRVGVTFDDHVSDFVIESTPPQTRQLYRPSFLRLQEAMNDAGVVQELNQVRVELAEASAEELSDLLTPFVVIALAQQLSFTDEEAAQGPRYLGVHDPLTLHRSLAAVVHLLQVASGGPVIGPAPAPIPVPGDGPPPAGPALAARITTLTPAGQTLVSSAFTTYGPGSNFKRAASFTPAGWAPTGVVNGLGALTYYQYSRSVSVTIETCALSELCVVYRCPGSCWGTNDTTICETYATVVATKTVTYTELRMVWAPDYSPTGTRFPPVPPPPNAVPVLANLSPAP